MVVDCFVWEEVLDQYVMVKKYKLDEAGLISNRWSGVGLASNLKAPDIHL